MTLWSNRHVDKGHLKIKQGKESERVYWMPLLSHGKLHVELLGSTSPGDKVEGMSDFVEKLNKAVCLRFPNNTDRHRIVLVDRGEGFYKSNRKITHGFVTALRKQGLKAFHGKDAECQPGRSGDLWLHAQFTSKCDCTAAAAWNLIRSDLLGNRALHIAAG